MFERFTDRARRAVVGSQEEARELGSPYIGTEHLLLALLAPSDYPGISQSIPYAVLTELGFERDRARAKLREMSSDPASPAGTSYRVSNLPGHIPFTPRAKKVLELALRESLQLGHNYIGAEHLLLAICREGEGVASKLLLTLDETNGDPANIRQRIMAMITASQTGAAPDTAPARTVTIKPVDLAQVMELLAVVLEAVGARPEDDSVWQSLRDLSEGTREQVTNSALVLLIQRLALLTQIGMPRQHILYQLYDQIKACREFTLSPPASEPAPT